MTYAILFYNSNLLRQNSAIFTKISDSFEVLLDKISDALQAVSRSVVGAARIGFVQAVNDLSNALASMSVLLALDRRDCLQLGTCRLKQWPIMNPIRLVKLRGLYTGL